MANSVPPSVMPSWKVTLGCRDERGNGGYAGVESKLPWSAMCGDDGGDAGGGGGTDGGVQGGGGGKGMIETGDGRGRRGKLGGGCWGCSGVEGGGNGDHERVRIGAGTNGGVEGSGSGRGVGGGVGRNNGRGGGRRGGKGDTGGGGGCCGQPIGTPGRCFAGGEVGSGGE